MIYSSPQLLRVYSFTPDGKSLLCNAISKATQKMEVWTISLSGDHKPKVIISDPNTNYVNPAVSKNGRWLAYSSDESHRSLGALGLLLGRKPWEVPMFFRDRSDAGQRLAFMLLEYADRPDVVVLGLTRGGVPVAFEIAQRLHAVLDVLVVRKLGAPWQPEFAIGAVAPGGVRIMNQATVAGLEIPYPEIDAMVARELREIECREALYRAERPAVELCGKPVIIVDDGLATGSTMRAAVETVRRAHPAEVIIAVPVAAQASYEEFRPLVDKMVCVLVRDDFFAVGQWYTDFRPVEDSEVIRLVDIARSRPAPAAA